MLYSGDFKNITAETNNGAAQITILIFIVKEEKIK